MVGGRQGLPAHHMRRTGLPGKLKIASPEILQRRLGAEKDNAAVNLRTEVRTGKGFKQGHPC